MMTEIEVANSEFHADGRFIWCVFHSARSTLGNTLQLPHSAPTGGKSIGCNRWKHFLGKKEETARELLPDMRRR